MAFDKFIRFFSQSVKYTYTHTHTHINFSARGIGKNWLWPRMSPPCKHLNVVVIPAAVEGREVVTEGRICECGSVCDSNNPIELCSDSELRLFAKTGYHKDC